MKFVEDAVRRRAFDETVRETRARNAHIRIEEIDSATDEAAPTLTVEPSPTRSTVELDVSTGLRGELFDLDDTARFEPILFAARGDDRLDGMPSWPPERVSGKAQPV